MKCHMKIKDSIHDSRFKKILQLQLVLPVKNSMNRQILKKLQILTKKLQRLTTYPARVLYEFFRNYSSDQITSTPALNYVQYRERVTRSKGPAGPGLVWSS